MTFWIGFLVGGLTLGTMCFLVGLHWPEILDRVFDRDRGRGE
jgi:hypothetical protein